MRLPSSLRLALLLGSLMLAACIKTHDDDAESATSETDASAVPADEPTDLERGVATLGATLGCANYDEQSRHCLLLKIDYRVDSTAGAAASARPALNIALVLDRSTSMREDEKLPDALAAAHWLVQNLTERDTLTVIAVDERATILAAAAPVINRPFLHHRINDVFANGTADLSTGLREGIAQLQSSGDKDQRKHVLLLTEAPTARAQAAKLEQLVKQSSASGISVSTLTMDSPDQVATALRTVLEKPLPIVARDAVIRVTMEEGHISKMYGQLPIAPAQTQKLPLGDLRATEHGFALVQLEPAAFAFGTTVQARVALEFADPLTGEKQSREIRLRSSYASDARSGRDQTSASSMLADVLATLEIADSASRGFDVDRYREAKTSFASLRQRAHEYAIAHRDQELLNQVFVLAHMMEELDAAHAQGLLHGHEQARAKLPNERDYLLYLFSHHR
jgi:Mg-chelatase subunit ChlD